ncbi:MAG: hypothetical protein NC405_06940 [Odoribacter sp.]|nr:hypothetical protein [Odoribacter sp.]
MKKLYLLLLALVLTGGINFAASAAGTTKLTCNDFAGIIVRADATSWTGTGFNELDLSGAINGQAFTLDYNKTNAQLMFAAADGYEIESITGVKADGTTALNFTNGNIMSGWTVVGQFKKVPQVNANGGSVNITVKKAASATSEFSLKISGDGAIQAIKSAYISQDKVNKPALTLKEGDNSFEFVPGTNDTFTIEIANRNDKDCFTLTKNGAAIEWDTEYKCFTTTLAADDKFELTYEKQAQTVTLNLEIPDAASITNIFDRTALTALTLTGGKLTVEKEHTIQFTIQEDYCLDAVTFTPAGEGAESQQITDFTSNSLSYTATEDGTLTLDVRARVYNDVIYTAYVVCAEGIDIYAGNMSGPHIELTNGELVENSISLGKITEQGTVISPAYTIPAGTAYKYTFTISDKYQRFLIMDKEGYWIRAIREGNTSKYDSSVVTSTTMWIVGEKVENDTKAAVVVYGGDGKEIRIVSGSTYGANISSTYGNGTHIFEFDSDYQNPFTIRPNGETIDGMTVKVNDTAMSPDDNGVWSGISIAPYSVIRIGAGASIPSPAAITFNGNYATVEYCEVEELDHYTTITDLTQALSCYAGGVLKITPKKYYSISIDGTAVELDADGTYTYRTTGKAAKIEFTAPDYVLTPASGETVESLEAITIAFPAASSVELNPDVIDGIMLHDTANAVYGSVTVDVTPVADAEVPTMSIKFGPVPAAQTNYHLYFEPETFLFDGGAAKSAVIEANYTLQKQNATTPSDFAPSPVNATFNLDWGQAPSFWIAFEEGTTVTEGDAYQKIEFSLNGAAIDFWDMQIWLGEGEAANNVQFFMCDPNHAEETGTLTMKAPAGAFNISGTASDAFEHTWTLKMPGTYTTRTSLDDLGQIETRHLAEIIIYFEGAEHVSIYEPAANGIYLRGSMDRGTYQYKYNVSPTITPYNPTDAQGIALLAENTGVTAYKLTFDPAPVEDDNYSLYVPYGSFRLDNMVDSDPINTTYSNVSGVEDVTVDASADGEIFNLQGIRMDAEWSDLPAGLYIRGGKVVLKK